jgi:serine/threonine protein phosphatase 1
MATIAVGDIHGNLEALEDLLEQLSSKLKAGDTLVFLGDYIDCGVNSRACVERILNLMEQAQFSVITLLGNHEDWMLKTMRDPCSHSWLIGMGAFKTVASYSRTADAELRNAAGSEGARLLMERVPLPYSLFFDAMPEVHKKFFLNLRPYWRTPDAVCVHAGLNPRGGPVENQDTQTLIWGTLEFPQEYDGEEIVIYGHANHFTLDDQGWPKPIIKPNRTVCIDTISQGILTAIRFPDGAIFQSRRCLTDGERPEAK